MGEYAPTTPTAVCLQAYDILGYPIYRHTLCMSIIGRSGNLDIFFEFLDRAPPELRHVVVESSYSSLDADALAKLGSRDRFPTYLSAHNKFSAPYSTMYDAMSAARRREWFAQIVKAGFNPHQIYHRIGLTTPECGAVRAMDQWMPQIHHDLPHRMQANVKTFLLCLLREAPQLYAQRNMRTRLIRTFVHAELVYMQHFAQVCGETTTQLKARAAELLGDDHVRERKRAKKAAIVGNIKYAHLVADATFQRAFFDAHSVVLGDIRAEHNIRRAWLAKDSDMLYTLLNINPIPQKSVFTQPGLWDSSPDVSATPSVTLFRILRKGGEEALRRVVSECVVEIGSEHLAELADYAYRYYRHQDVFGGMELMRICFEIVFSIFRTRSDWKHLKSNMFGSTVHKNHPFKLFRDIYLEAVGRGMYWSSGPFLYKNLSWRAQWSRWTPERHSNPKFYTYGFRARADTVLFSRSWLNRPVRERIVRWLAVVYFSVHRERDRRKELVGKTKQVMRMDLVRRGQFLTGNPSRQDVYRMWVESEALWEMMRTR